MGEVRYHTCGHPLWETWNWNGLSHFPVWRDDSQESETAGKEVTVCPSCDETLDRKNVLNANDYETLVHYWAGQRT